MTPYVSKDYKHLLGLPGLSDALLSNHFALYEGYVVSVNKLSERLAELMRLEGAPAPEYAELKRRYGWEWNGMRLHELYFGNLSKETHPLDPSSSLAQQIVRDFGSLEAWEKDFRATGAMRGIGWVVLAYDRESERTFNVWINEHDLGHLAGGVPLLVMDVFEHAFMLDYGTKRADYIETFFRSIDWAATEKRFENQ